MLGQVGQSVPTLTAHPVFEIENVAAGLSIEKLHVCLRSGPPKPRSSAPPFARPSPNADRSRKFRSFGGFGCAPTAISYPAKRSGGSAPDRHLRIPPAGRRCFAKATAVHLIEISASQPERLRPLIARWLIHLSRMRESDGESKEARNLRGLVAWKNVEIDFEVLSYASGPRLLTWQSPQIQIAGPCGSVRISACSSHS